MTWEKEGKQRLSDEEFNARLQEFKKEKTKKMKLPKQVRYV